MENNKKIYGIEIEFFGENPMDKSAEDRARLLQEARNEGIYVEEYESADTFLNCLNNEGVDTENMFYFTI